ncbi:hypothetical protein WA588_001679, partial [Blastocystis sp. NMH]
MGVISFFVYLFILLSVAEAKVKTKSFQLSHNQNKTVCVSGDSSLLKVWSYEEISITSSYGDPVFYIKSDDSSYFKSLFSLLFGSQFASWNSQYLYDVSKNEDHSVDIILSPYGQSCVLLTNPYDTSEVPMRVSVSVERKFSLLYPLLIAISVVLYVYAKDLCFFPIFYYTFFMVLSPVLAIPYLYSHVIQTLVSTSPYQSILTGAHYLFTLVFSISILLRHQTIHLLSLFIASHPISFTLYCLTCFLLSLFLVNRLLDTVHKRDIQFLFSFLRTACVILIVHSTASVRVSLFFLFLVTFVGLLTNRLNPRHLLRQWRILLDVKPTFNLNEFLQMRDQLEKMRSCFLNNMELQSSVQTSNQYELRQFIQSPFLIMPSKELMSEMMRVLNVPKSHHVETMDTSTLLLEE